ncbi:MAG: diguanylate cyclase response regulator [Sulfurimonas sp. RIFOXYD12_FULL_33_39]|uniref:GGDEF domain-containing response regulator n=1 Tax=unclassified Sulfurimonas TaxID=2623549 RepID=UPI0008B8F9AB|nr:MULTISPECIES: diguanylate cyclase [unclassified Sulfurimonas]OHE10589.1 MAG: diguanylate cyclase response regulator [Sulfurimonas sp. RIFOXYD12_FULL_33_39]OHE15048.1 MAG: diguanylate cyclase response regulator [Sulfurimonas sp. RIFOXYD2_FULL_34_21]DAB28647.1 MAG TPA: diguanylate cyclase response regulator [Sulfurimonas sp. UBA10385]
MFNHDTILAVDDTKENLDIILDILEDFDVIPLTSGKKALELLKNEEVSLILLDIVMPEMNGFEVCKILRSQTNTKNIPIIFTTAKTDEESISKAYEAGANDYVSKPLKRSEVIERVKTQLKLKKTIEDLEFLASRDSMTGIYNRRKFFELVNELFKESGEELFLCMIDIDFFKKINDSFGHDAGDLVIKLITKTISDMLPQDSIFARIGGEEFVAVCKKPSKEDTVELFDNIRKKISTLKIDYNSNDIGFTISSGITQKRGVTKTIDEMLKEADLALYEAKSSGRNKVVFR